MIVDDDAKLLQYEAYTYLFTARSFFSVLFWLFWSKSRTPFMECRAVFI